MNDRELVRLLTHLDWSTDFPKMLPERSKRPEVYDCGPPGDDGCQIDPKTRLLRPAPGPAAEDADLADDAAALFQTADESFRAGRFAAD
ncbi:MAG: hypothetical protein PHU21_01840 [Elusimicrobia bacterium]|nr:hypothetical protein [Elusimicrobiota bacterium]